MNVVGCILCSAQGPPKTDRDQAIFHWNRRDGEEKFREALKIANKDTKRRGEKIAELNEEIDLLKRTIHEISIGREVNKPTN